MLKLKTVKTPAHSGYSSVLLQPVSPQQGIYIYKCLVYYVCPTKGDLSCPPVQLAVRV